MSHLLYILMLVTNSLAGSSFQSATIAANDVVFQSLRIGSAQQLAVHFDTNIELIIDSEAIEFQSIQATHAELILKSFFRKYPPRHFQYIYRGTAERQRYSTGLYQTGLDQFQVYILMRETPNPDKRTPHYRIKTLHFRKAGPMRS